MLSRWKSYNLVYLGRPAGRPLVWRGMQRESTNLIETDVIKIMPQSDEQSARLPLLKEKAFYLLKDGNRITSFVTLPGHMREMIYGYLFSEGYVDDKSQIVIQRETETLMDIHILEEKREKMPTVKTPVTKENIFSLAEAFQGGMPLHDQTYMTHSVFLMHKSEIIFSCEDLGRHNALDKAIGYALLNEVPLSECFVYMSGRLQKDAAEKAVRSGLSALISKAGATQEAVRVARENALTLIGRARPDQAYILSKGEMP